MIKELNKLVAYFKSRSEQGTTKASIEVWQEAAEELERILRQHDSIVDISEKEGYNPFCDDPECPSCNGLGADGHIW